MPKYKLTLRSASFEGFGFTMKTSMGVLNSNLDCVHTLPAHFENGENFDG